MRSTPRYSRILLKLSGESFKGGKNFGIDYQTVRYIAGEIKQVHDAGVGIGVVVGGGNMWRGTDYEAQGMDRSSADHAGMLATVMNALVLHDQLERDGIPVRTMTAIPMPTVAEPYVRSRALHHLERGRTLIFAAGTGNPFMSTDTAASLRALEMNAGILVMAKNGVDGVYDADPATVPTAKKFDHITHHRALELGLQALDSTALSLAMDNKMPIIVFDMFKLGNLAGIVSGGYVGTRITVDAAGEQLHMPQQASAS
ncbi:MAG: UMP kinase [Chloroflexi bacterium]|nr:UMP kinase [Chloroflexota bacterium]